MRSVRLLFAALVLCALAAPASAAPPTYLFLTGPTHDAGHPHPHHEAPASYGYVQPVAAMPYAYGWFGACPRQHYSRSFGYYRNYTEWKAQ